MGKPTHSDSFIGPRRNQGGRPKNSSKTNRASHLIRKTKDDQCSPQNVLRSIYSKGLFVIEGKPFTECMSSQVDAFTHLAKKDSNFETIFERFSEKPAKMVKGQLMGAEIKPVSENKDRLTAPASGNSKKNF